MKPPIEPREEECCNSGCNPCIFDVYQRQLELYQNNNKDSDHTNDQNGISELEYTAFIVIDTIQICKAHKIVKLKKLNNEECMNVWWNPGDHFLVKYTSKQSTCSRAYTPVKLKMHSNDDYHFMIVIKKYNDGLVSNYLYNLEVGEVTMWRGPYGHYKIESNKYDRIIMIAQGTGIAPFMSIIDNIISNEDDMTKIVLYFCCRSLDEVLFRNELYNLKAYWNFTYKVFLSNSSGKEFHLKYEEPICSSKFDGKELQDLNPFVNNQFLLCGSQQFMNAYEKSIRDEYYSDNIILF
ncbi:NADH-cytochrome b5 reductase-like [Melitaea cinxia]|uniref:NADH-cytochrome b5 reductase-like n=1 Tax=Melitaea cinxia TaxID=113334 RepID=UPI001E26F58A|nr:NADH-cytochrome b5 reductase-like [Melitaea cinxia]